MTDSNQRPSSLPSDINNWPMLKIVYRTKPEAIAALLPPGIEPMETSNVTLTVYNLPVPDEPELGVLITVDASYNGIPGEWTIGYGIDQEAAVIFSQIADGQPKFPCTVEYYTNNGRVAARSHHQGYTFMEFSGDIGEEDPIQDESIERNEWWIKYSPAAGWPKPGGFDYPPHVIHINANYGPGYRLKIDNPQLNLMHSPWDPIERLLPIEDMVSSHLWWPEYRGRTLKTAGPVDPDAFEAFRGGVMGSYISGSTWPGFLGGPQAKYNRRGSDAAAGDLPFYREIKKA